MVYIRKEKAMYPSACFNLVSRKQEDKVSLLYSTRLQKSSQVNTGGRRKVSHSRLCLVSFPSNTMLCIFFFFRHDRKSKGQCVRSIFRSTVTKEGEFSIDFCPKVHKSSQQVPTEPFPVLGAFK